MLNSETENTESKIGRKGFFRNLFMFGGLVAGYGMVGSFALKYLFPGRRKLDKLKLFVGKTTDILVGQSKAFTTPEGEGYLLTNTGSGQNPFIAFSSRCPHLGCKVGWQEDKNRFYCPCHGGAFDANGVATEGPPAQDGQSLKSCEVLVEGKAVYAMVDRA